MHSLCCGYNPDEEFHREPAKENLGPLDWHEIEHDLQFIRIECRSFGPRVKMEEISPPT